MSPDEVVWATPRPHRIERWSPSTVNLLDRCLLAGAFRFDERFAGLRRPSTFSALGNIAHRLHEATAREASGGGESADWLRSRWAEIEALEAAKLEDAWRPAQPPPPVEWPGYHLTRARTLRRLEPEVRASRSTDAGEGRSGGVEVELSDPDSGLFGIVDRIEEIDGEVRVVELKTSLRIGEPEDRHRRQLDLYGVLVKRASGQWPSTVGVETAGGRSLSAPLQPQDAIDTFEAATSLVEGFNERVAEPERFVLEARPDDDRCAYCDFQPVCGPYWSSLEADWNHGSVLGEVRQLSGSSRGHAVTLEVVSPALEGEGTEVVIAGLHTE